MQTLTITPNQNALLEMAEHIWEIAKSSKTRPLVILPTAGPNASLRQALERLRPSLDQANVPFLPEVHSLSDWLELAPDIFLIPDQQSQTERILQTYASIDAHPELQTWFAAEGEGGVWSLAQAIVSACELLSQSIMPHLSWDPNTLDLKGDMQKLESVLQSAIDTAYPKLAHALVSKEANVLLAFWRYLGSVRDPIIRKHLALASYVQQFAQHPQSRRPLIWIDTVEPQPAQASMQTQFLEACTPYIPVHRLQMDWSSVALWSEAISAEVGAQEEAQAKHNIHTLKTKTIRCITANRFEDLAWEATRRIETHLKEGRKHIALVAQDRLLARRTRALLARLGPSLSIADETGWKLSTTRAAAALHAWLELLRSPSEGPSASTLLEFLKNPFLDLEHLLNTQESNCDLLITELENALLIKQARSSWVSFYLAIEAGASSEYDPRLQTLLQVIRQRVGQWQSKAMQTPYCAEALLQLHEDLSAFGMKQGFEQDAAGLQLLHMLQTLGMQQSKLGQLRMPLNEWLILLKTVMEEEVYREQGAQTSARVSILPLSSTRLRYFDAVVMVGCDERQLPAFSEPPLFFSETLCQVLGGSSVAWQFRQQARDLSQLIASYEHIDLLWQSEGARGEPLRASPWIQRLQNHLPTLATIQAKAEQRTAQARPSAMASAHRLPGLPMPTRMSPSAYRALRSCPYQYYVRNLLGLRKRKGLDEELDASLLGQTLHQILRNFFQELKSTQIREPRLQDPQYRQTWMQEHLHHASEQGFLKLLEGDKRILGSLRDWQKQIPSFVAWQLERESHGWQFHDAELKVGFEFSFTDAHHQEHTVRIEGYADRLDINTTLRQAAVLDYKHQSPDKIKKRADQLMDDPQLLLYTKAITEEQKATDHPVIEADWVALKMNLKKKDSSERSFKLDHLSDQVLVLEKQLQQDLSAVWSGAAMQAFAPESACRYCEARGICRKGMW